MCQVCTFNRSSGRRCLRKHGGPQQSKTKLITAIDRYKVERQPLKNYASLVQLNQIVTVTDLQETCARVTRTNVEHSYNIKRIMLRVSSHAPSTFPNDPLYGGPVKMPRLDSSGGAPPFPAPLNGEVVVTTDTTSALVSRWVHR